MEKLPAWNNLDEYQAMNSADFDLDLQQVKSIVSEIEKANAEVVPLFTQVNQPDVRKNLISKLQKISEKQNLASTLLYNLSVYCSCEKSLNSENDLAIKTLSNLQDIGAALSIALADSEIFLSQCDDQVVQEYLQAPTVKPNSFLLNYERRRNDFLLSPEEEKTLSQFSSYAFDGWSNLYFQISGSLKVNREGQAPIGLAKASGDLRSDDAKLRESTWKAVQASWKQMEIPCAAILNNLVGYRLELNRKRSHKKKVHYLDPTLHEARVQKATVDAMLAAIEKRSDIGVRAMRAMAKGLKKEKLAPWDIFAPSPRAATGSHVAFADGLVMVTDAFASVDPAMGEFVKTMSKNNWIEARDLPNKASGAHCTKFAKSRNPRVFQTYAGSLKDVSTLAHELGHAYHNWVMRDLPIQETHYPMTLAETASIFSETVLADVLFEKAKGDEKFSIAWENAVDAVGFLMNIPARFEFEKSLYEARDQGPVSPAELNQMTDAAWTKWYQGELTENETQFWMTKLHFSFSKVSFYNYPYTFGYLFGLGVFARKQKLGGDFHQAYVNLLRDTGRMTVEEVAQKHLQVDLTKPDFWLDSIAIVDSKVAALEKLL
jgi:oligoendopeptidase F